jgi:pyruvate/2-oxoglutarate dehydrogenase complex dihydrolipoamide dehydrogenase (E3) component
MTRKFDAIVVGAGQAGPSLTGRLTAAGMTVAMIERKLFGGTCVNTGCTPTKTLIANAYAAHLATHGADYGVATGPIAIDMKKVKARADEVSGNSRRSLENWLDNMERCTVFRGHARFEGPKTMSVNGEVIEAERIFLNVGARASVPELPGLDQIDYLTNSSVLELDTLPRHLVILGGSYIGLEFAQMYRRFGAEVTVIERDARLIGREDEDVSDAIKEILVGEGIAIHLGADVVRFSKRGSEFAVQPRAGAAEIVGSHLLLAVGRRPNTDDLGLDKAGVKTDRRGYIEVDDKLSTNVPGIWALGDCNGKGAFTHTSYNDFEIVAANLLDNDRRRVSDRIPTYALFIDPPLGRAGMTEAAVKKSGRKALIGTRPMTRVSRAIEKGDTRGFMKVMVDAETKEILGAAILGTGGDEVIHSILDVMAAKAPYTAISRTMHIHPTVSELVPTMLGEMKELV